MVSLFLALTVGLLGGALFQTHAALRAERARSLTLAEAAMRVSANVAEVRGAVSSMRQLHEDAMRKASGYVAIARTSTAAKDAETIAGIDRQFQAAAEAALQL